jgi:hypothetical protein
VSNQLGSGGEQQQQRNERAGEEGGSGGGDCCSLNSDDQLGASQPRDGGDAGVGADQWAGAVGACGAVNTIHLGGERFTLIRPPPPPPPPPPPRPLIGREAPSCLSPANLKPPLSPTPNARAEKGCASSVATLVLCAPTEPEMKELNAVVRAATMVGFVVWGLGLWWRYIGFNIYDIEFRFGYRQSDPCYNDDWAPRP